MPQLHQLNAIVEGVKKSTHETLTDIYQKTGKPDLFYGSVRTYTPIRAEDPTSHEGEQLPAEARQIQADGPTLLKRFCEAQEKLLDVVLNRDLGNTQARADVVVGDVTLFKQVPVPFLLWLEKQLGDMATEIKKLPILDPSEKWERNDNLNCWSAASVEQARTKKIPKPLILHPGTKEHPPQVKEVMDDVRVGTYRTTRYSSAFQATERDEMLLRIEKVLHAVKFAREKANEIKVQNDSGRGADLYRFLFPAIVK